MPANTLASDVKTEASTQITEQPWFKHYQALRNQDKQVNPITAPLIFMRDLAPLMNSKDKVAEWASNRLNHVLSHIDYERLIEDVDKSTSVESQSSELWTDLTSTHARIDFLQRRIEAVREGSKFSIHTALGIQDLVVDIERLERRTSNYLLKEQIASTHTDVPPVSDLLQSTTVINSLTIEERGFRARSDTSFSIPRSPNSLRYLNLEESSEIISQNPALLVALSRRIELQQTYLQANSVDFTDIDKSADRAEREKFLIEHSSYILYLNPESDEDRIALQNFALANRMRALSEESDYYVNKLHRTVSRMFERALESNQIANIESSRSDISEETALSVLRDEIYALRIFQNWSEVPSREMTSAIADFVFLANEGRLSPKDARIFLVGLMNKIGNMDSSFPERDWLADASTLPEIDISELVGEEFQHVNTETMKERLVTLQKVLGVPLGLLLNYIDFVPAERDSGEHVVYECNSDKFEIYQYSLEQEHIRTIMHELGETIVKHLPLEYIIKYAEIFNNVQKNGRKFVTAYSEHEWLEGRQALAIKEDFCETVAEFCGGYESNSALYQTCPQRYLYMLDLISHFIKPEQRSAYMYLLLSFVSSDKEAQALPDVESWNTDGDESKLFVSGKASASKKRLERALGIEEKKKKEIDKQSIHVFARGLLITQ